ncbi:MAG: hypothetical protein DCF22_23170, partial [Leptolyngbya sp.]
MAEGNSDLTTNWQLSSFITDQFVPISIEIFDEDGGLNFGDDHIDVNPNSGNKNLNLIYDQLTGGNVLGLLFSIRETGLMERL